MPADAGAWGRGFSGYRHDASAAMRSRSAHYVRSGRAAAPPLSFILTACAVATGQHAFGYLVPGRPPQYSDSFQQVEAAHSRLWLDTHCGGHTSGAVRGHLVGSLTLDRTRISSPPYKVSFTRVVGLFYLLTE